MRGLCTLGSVFSRGLGFWSWDSNFWGFVVSQNVLVLRRKLDIFLKDLAVAVVRS